MDQTAPFYKVGSFWVFVRKTIKDDQELLLYFAIYAFFSVIPFLIFTVLLFHFIPDPKPIHFLPLPFVWFANLFILRLSQFVVAHTLIERESGNQPTIHSAVRYTRENFSLVTRLVCANYIFDILLFTLGVLINSVMRGSKPGSRRLTDFIFGATDTTTEVFIGFLVPMAICSREKEMKTLFLKTTQFIHDNFWGGLVIDKKLSIVFTIILIPFLVSLAVLPNFLSQGEYNLALIGGIYFMILIAQGIGMCETLLYSKMVLLSEKGMLSGDALRSAVAKLGAQTEQ